MVTKIIKVMIEAGKANPSPPLGPVLGQAKVNIMSFCKAFNEETKSMVGTIPVIIYVNADNSYKFICKKPSATSLIKNHFKITSGSSKPRLSTIKTINKSDLFDLAVQKQDDMSCFSKDPEMLNKAVSMLIGSAISMGIEVLDS